MSENKRLIKINKELSGACDAYQSEVKKIEEEKQSLINYADEKGKRSSEAQFEYTKATKTIKELNNRCDGLLREIKQKDEIIEK